MFKMTFYIRYIWLYFLILFAACTSNTEKIPVSDEKQNGNPEINFEKQLHNFGELAAGEKVSYTFTFKNTGDANLIVKDVTASCGCTVPQWDKHPVAPEQTGKIEVIFDSSGRKGDQYKTIKVMSNASNKETLLVITAEIKS